jgi:hypothetical protein
MASNFSASKIQLDSKHLKEFLDWIAISIGGALTGLAFRGDQNVG